MTVSASSSAAPHVDPIRLHVRRIPAIDPDPPYEDEPPAPRATVRTDGALALAGEVQPAAPAGAPDRHDAASALRVVGSATSLAPPAEPEEGEPGLEVPFDPVPTPPADLPPVRQRAAVLVRAVLEVLAGDRSPAQLTRCTSPEVYSDIESRLGHPAPRPWAATLRSLRVCEPSPGIAEVAAVVRRGVRAGAVAMRLEGLDGRWQVTALDLV